MDNSRASRAWTEAERWLLPGLLLLAAGLRLYKLEQDSFWTDELFQGVIAKGSLWQAIFPTTANTGGAPIDYIVSHFAYHYLGPSEGMMRLPPVLWGVLSILVIFVLGKKLFGKPTAYLATALLTITPLHIEYSREVRFYSLPTLLVLLGTYLLVCATEKNTRKVWALYGLVMLLALFTQFYTIFVFGLHALWMILFNRRLRSALIAFLVTATITFLLFLPGLIYYLFIATQTLTFRSTPPTLAAILTGPLYDTYPAGRLLGTGASIDAINATIILYWNLSRLAFGLYGTLLLLAIVTAFNRRANPAFITALRLMVVLTIGGIAAMLILDFKTGYPLTARQFLLFTPFLLLAVSATLVYLCQLATAKMKPNRRALVTSAVCLLMIAASLLIFWQPIVDVLKPSKQDWRGTARYLLQNVGPGDAFISPYADFFGYYAPELLTKTPFAIPDDEAAMAQLVQSHQQVWIALVSSPGYDRPKFITEWIKDKRLVEVPLHQLNDDFEIYVYKPDKSF